MSPVTHQVDFCYGHRLLHYSGKCRYLHGHNGRAVLVLSPAADPQQGGVQELRGRCGRLDAWILDQLDHRMILNAADPAVDILRRLGDPVYLLPHNPTAENIARLVYEQARQYDLPVIEVRLWETPRSYATYRANTGT